MLVRSQLRTSALVPHDSPRRGVVLLAVLVVLVLLALAGYNYIDLMIAESQASDNYHRVAKVKAIADSGVHYAAALLSNADHMDQLLGNNPYDNAEKFKNVPLMGDDGKPVGYFTLLAPIDPYDHDGNLKFRPGVADETGKINLNALMKKDTSGEELLGLLQKLPELTEEIAACIVDYLDADKETRASGAEDDHYQSMDPPYRAKNGPLDQLDELLLVKGVTELLLYGDDSNRNGIQDPGEGTDGSFNRGWSAFLTIHSREQNLNSKGQPLIDINDTAKAYDTLEKYYDALSPTLGEDLTKFVILKRQYKDQSSGQSVVSSLFSLLTGGSTKTVGKFQITMGKDSKKSSTTTKPPPVEGKLGDVEIDFTKKPSQQIKSLYDLVDSSVTISGPDPKDPKKTVETIYHSPLKDKNQRKLLLPLLFDLLTASTETDFSGRININTAPEEVLKTLPDFTQADVDQIIAGRPKYAFSQPASALYQTPAWLAIETNIKMQTLKNAEKYITTRSQVYKFQVLGFVEEGRGPAARVEAVVDTNGGRPRIIAWRDLSDLGRTARME